jgi:hypothetical protein
MEEAAVDHVFLLITHTEEGGDNIAGMYTIPEEEVSAFERVISPRLPN